MPDNTVFSIFVTLVALVASIIVLVISAKVIKFIFLRKLSENDASFYGSLKKVQGVIEKSQQKLAEPMVPYGKYKDLLQKEANALDRMNFIKEEQKQIEQNIRALNAEATEKERAKDELTKNSGNTLKLIGELIATRTTLEDEVSVLHGNLEVSKSELKTLVEEIEMAEGQKAAFKEVSKTLDEVKDRLFEVSSTYKDSAKNLMELENQYQSLEKEYKKLIELNLQKEAAAASAEG